MVNLQQPIYLFAGGRGKTIFSSFKEMGKVIALLKSRPAGRADMGKVSALVKARLS